MVPVNLKPFEDNLPEELGNYFALVMLPMPLGVADVRDRIRQMKGHMERIKHSDEAVLTFGLQRTISASPRPGAVLPHQLLREQDGGRAHQRARAPAACSASPAAPVLQVVGFAPCSGDQPMTATILSYNGTVTVGFATDSGLVPDPDVLADLVVHEIQAMKKELSTRKRRPKPTPKPTQTATSKAQP